MSDRRLGGCWPTPEQTLLLQAAVLGTQPAQSAFDTWRSRVDINRLDYGSARLLAFVYLNLRDRLTDDDVVTRAMRERYERAIADNDRRLVTLTSVIATFRDAGIDTLVLKGMALVATGHLPPGARPMDDLDVLVPEAQAIEARDLLLASGWRLVQPMNRDRLSVGHGAELSSPAGDRLDLHWHVFAECCGPGADDVLWQAAETVRVNGVGTRVLCSADFLLHVTAHGLRWSTVPPVRWAADAVTIMRAAGDRLDWNRLVHQAIGRRLTLPVIDALRYLRDDLGIVVPAPILRELQSAPAPPLIVAEHRVRMQTRSPSRQARYHWIRHRRLSGRSWLGDLARYPEYLRCVWGLPSRRDLARHITLKLTSRWSF